MMLLKDVLDRGDIEKGNVIIYQWKKEEVVQDKLMIQTKLRDLFAAFMVERVEEAVIFDYYGAFPNENIVAVFKPFTTQEISLAMWKRFEARMCTDTIDLLINRLLDIFSEGILIRDHKYFEVKRKESFSTFRLIEVDENLARKLQKEHDKNRKDAQEDRGDAAEELSRLLSGEYRGKKRF